MSQGSDLRPPGRTLLSRREVAAYGAAACGAACGAVIAGLVIPDLSMAAAAAPVTLQTRAIPHSGEKLPVVGVGTAIVFDVGSSPERRAACTEVLRALNEQGGALVDTAPSYGSAESVIGDILMQTTLRGRVFLATKLEHYGDGGEAAELHDSLQRLRTDKVDLLQLHNVRAASQDLAPLRALQSKGLCRYTGVTTTYEGSYDAIESVVKRERPDFVEVDYALDNRDAEARVIPAAADAGAAVLAALPFGRGRLFRVALGKPLPDWAAEFDCTSWAQFFLKFLLGNPAVTAVIPGTDKAVHMRDNLGAGFGRLPDAAMRARMVKYVESLG